MSVARRILAVCCFLTLSAEMVPARRPGQLEQVEFTVEVPERITQGEPLMASVTVANGRDRPIVVDFGWNQVGAFWVEATLPGGRRLKGMAKEPKLGGISRLPRVTIVPKGHYSQWLPLSEWVDLQVVGRTELMIRFVGEIQDERGSVLGAPQEWRRTIEIGPRDVTALTRLCVDLTAAIRQTRDAEQRLRSAATLAGVRDPIAIPFMKRVAQDGEVTSTMVDGLIAAGTIGARDALEELARDGNADVAALARSGLRRFVLRQN